MAQTQTFTSSGTFTVPAGVTSITVKAWGGGGAGGGGGNKEGGGGGGAFATRVITVTPGQMFPVTIGSGGTTPGSPGGNSQFGTTAPALVIAVGGSSGSGNAGATGGLASACTPVTGAFSGGNGGAAASGGGNNAGGGGGGSATDAANGGVGGNGSGNTGGTGGTGEGIGGNGGSNGGNGFAGLTPGGGGGGRGSSSGTSGSGANGRVIVTWACNISATISGTNTICAGNSTDLSVDITGGASPYTVVYTDGLGNTSTATNYTSGSPISVSPGSTAIYTLVSVTDAGSCTATLSGSATITVNLPPTCSISGSTEVCANSTGNNYSGPVGAGLGYAWSISGNGTIVGNNDMQTVSVDAAGIGTYTVTLTLTDGNSCTSSCSQTVTINPNPSCSIDGPTAVCASSTHNYNGPSDMSSYAWSISGNGSIAAGANAYTVTVDAGSTGSYTLTLTVVDGNSCSATCMQQVTVNALPTATVSGTTEVCLDATAPDITFTGANGAEPYTFTYTINTGPDLTVSTTSGSSVTVTAPTDVTGEFIYTLVSVSDNNGCSQTQTGTATITVNPNPSCLVTGPDPVCTGTTGNVYSAPTGMATYSWSIAGDGTINGADDQETVTVDAGAPGTYTITVVITDGNSCTATCDKTVTVGSTFSCSIAGAEVACPGETYFYTAPAGMSTYAWSVGGDATISGPDDEASVTVIAGASGTYTVSLALTQGSSCTASCALPVLITPPPALELVLGGPSNATCGDDMLAVTVSVGSGFTDLGSLQYNLNWDTSLLMYASHTVTSIGGLAPTVGAGVTNPMTPPGIGFLSYSWLDPAGFDGEDLPDNELLLTVFFKVLTDGPDATITVTGNPTPIEVTNYAFCEGTITAQPIDITLDPVTIALTPLDPVCPGVNSIDLAFTGTTGGPDQYSLDFDGVAELAGFVDVPLTALPTSPISITVPGTALCGTYNAVLTILNSDTGCENTYDIAIVLEDNTPPVLIDPQVDCSSLNMVDLDQCLSVAAAFDATTLEGDVADLYQDNCVDPVKVALTGTTAGLLNTDCDWTFTYTFTISDNCNNNTSCSVVYSGRDKSAPTWTTAAGALDVTIECNNTQALANAQALLPVATDNCDLTVANLVKVPGTLVPGSCPQAGTITNTFTVTDECGNTSVAFTQVITVTDTQAPTWVTLPNALDRTLQCSDNVGLAAAQSLSPTATDNCDIILIPVKTVGTFAEGTNCPQAGTYTNTWVVTDDCGNTSSVYTQVITIIDTQAPTWSTLAGSLDRTVECSDGQAIMDAQALFPVAADNCDQDVTDIDKNSGMFVAGTNCPQAGTYTNTWTVTDDCGNTSTVFTQVITVRDITPPFWTTAANALNRTVECSDGQAIMDAQALFPTAEDNCDLDVTNIVKTSGSFLQGNDCPQAGTYTNTWVVTDDCGNTSSVYTQVITVVDTESPTGDCPQGTNYGNICAANAPPAPSETSVAAAYTDNCGTVTATFVSSVLAGDNCGGWTNTHTYTISDGCTGNDITCVIVDSGADTESPMGTCPQGTDYGNVCAANAPAAPSETTVAAAYTDNCGTVTATYVGSVLAGDDCGGWTNTHTYTISDGCPDNNITCVIVDRGIDTEAPKGDCPQGTDYGNVCAANAPAAPSEMSVAAAYTDNCGTVVATLVGSVLAGDDCGGWTNTHTYTVSDGCPGNVITCVIVDRGMDTEAPMGTCPQGTDYNNICAANAPAAPSEASVAAAYSDNCGTVTATLVSSVLDGDDCQWTNTHTYTISDGCPGNVVTCVIIDSGRDSEAPSFTTPANIPGNDGLQCGAENDLNNTGFPTSLTDNCLPNEASGASGYTTGATSWTTAAGYVISFTDVITDPHPNGDCSLTGNGLYKRKYRIDRTFRVEDACGNSSFGTQQINIVDNTPPVLSGCPADATVECNAVPMPASPTASDNCDGVVMVVYNGEIRTDGSCPDKYLLTRSWTATDDCGFATSCVQTISVQDTTDPVWDATMPADVTVNCDAVPMAGTFTATDNCDTDVQVDYAEVRTNGNCPDSYSLARTWIATDNCGNSIVHTQTVAVQDTTKPVITCPASVTVECDQSLMPGSMAPIGTATATDNCDLMPVLTYVDDSSLGNCPQESVIFRTWTATDACGNKSSCTQSITVDDSVPPVITCPANVTVDCDASTVPTATGTATATDNCTATPDISIGFNDGAQTPGACPQSYTINRTWLAVDACGNQTTCLQTVFVQDTTRPVITCPIAVTVECDADLTPGATLPTGIATATDNCDNMLTISHNDTPFANPMGCTQNYTIQRLWTAQDDCGNTRTCLQAITVRDTKAPVFTSVPANTTVECDAIPMAGLPTATDNCDQDVTITFDGEVLGTGNCTDNFTLTRTWTAADDCGNMTSTQQVITVQDTQDPVFTFVPADTSVECDAVPSAGTPTATDNCDQDVTITYDGETRSNGNCPDSYTLTRRWTATDNCGNSTQTQQVITVGDTQDPFFTSVPADASVECDMVPPVGTPTASDNCDPDVTITYDGETRSNGNCPDSYTLTRSWTATDNCGHSTQTQQVITVADTQDPVFTSVPANLSVECDVVPPVGTPTATDNCDLDVTITYDGEMRTDGNCPDSYTLTRSWTATDNCNNFTQIQQVIIVTDTQDPVFTSVPGDVSVECSMVPPVGTPTATDNCDQEVTITYDGEMRTNGDCADSYTLTRSWTATDNCGNSTVTQQVITVDDMQAPVFTAVPANTTVECDAVPTPGSPTATDACDTSVDIALNTVSTQSNDDTECNYTNYTITHTWTATDNCGNMALTTQVITVQDTQAPVLSGVPANTTAECDAVPPAATPTATDNCDPLVTILFNQTSTQSTNVNNCAYTNYTITRTWTATDNCGNATTEIQVIEVSDNTKPVIVCPPNVTISCEESLNPTVNTGLGQALATDNCDPNVLITYDDQKVVGQCPQDTIVTRTWLAADNCQNAAACNQTITKRDVLAPVITCPPNTTVECAQNQTFDPYVNTALGVATAIDNCDPGPLSYDYDDTTTPGGCDQEFTITRTWSAADACNNSTVCTQTIEVTDNTAPLIQCPPNITIECTVDPIPANTGSPVAVDACDPTLATSFADDEEPGACPQEYTIFRTWISSDGCGNAKACTQTIVVDDSKAPFWLTAVGALDTTLNCNDLAGIAFAQTLAPVAFDSCDNNVTDLVKQSGMFVTGACPQAGTYTNTWTVTDDCGNISTVFTQLITVQDTTKPSFMVPVAVTIYSDANCTYNADPSNTGDVTDAADNCSTNLNATYTDQIADGQCAGNKIITRTWSLDDGCGNILTQEQIITVLDTIQPSFPKPADSTLTTLNGASCPETASISLVVDQTNPVATGNAAFTFTVHGLTINGPTDYSDNCSTGDNLSLFVWNIVDDLNGTADDCQRQIRVVWRVYDDCGNFRQRQQTFTIQENTPPTFTVPASLTISCEQNPTDLMLAGDVTDEADNCHTGLEATYSDVTNLSGCNGTGTIARTWTLEDGCGNSLVQTQTITVVDQTAPVITCPKDTVINCQVDPIPANTGTATATDNCDTDLIPTFTDQVTPGNCPDARTISRRWTVADDCGNSTFCIQTIMVQDTTRPVITCPANVTINCEVDSIPANTGGFATATDNCDNNLTIIFTDVATPGNCANAQTISRRWVAVDNCNNLRVCVQTIVVQDITAPVITCPPSLTVECDASTLPANTGSATATDNCTAAPTITSNDVTTPSGLCPQEYTITRTWTADDGCGNSTNCIQTITVDDSKPPVIVCAPNVTVDCHLDLTPGANNPTGITTATDNCDSSPTVLLDDEIIISGNCPVVDTIFRTWVALDDCANAVACVQRIIVIDVRPPLLTCPADTVIDCNTSRSPDDLGYATAFDSCSMATTPTYTDVVVVGQCPQDSIITRTWRSEDACGNVGTCVQIITMRDTFPPVLDCPANVTVDCDQNTVPDVTGAASVTDNCDPQPTTPTYTDVVTPGACAQERSITRTWSSTDACGNTGTCVQLIEVQDTTRPKIVGDCDLFAQYGDNIRRASYVVSTSDGSDCPVAAQVNLDVLQEISDDYEITVGGIAVPGFIGCFADNCSDPKDLRARVVAINEAGDDCSKAFEVRLIVLDECDNESLDTISYLLEVIDDTAPVPPNPPASENYQCDSDVPAPGPLTALDNCAGPIVVVGTDTDNGGAGCANDPLIITRTWVFDDGCGNLDSVKQTITVVDTEAPVFTSCPPTTTVECSGDTSPASTGEPTASDNCATLVSFDFSDAIVVTGLPCPLVQTITRTWTAYDDCNNANASCVQLIQILDNTAPVITCPADLTIACNLLADTSLTGVATAIDACDATPTIVWEDAGSTGPCVNDTLSTITRTWFAFDNCGNVDVCDQVIAIIDDIAPVITCPKDTVINCEVDPIPANTGMPTATDNCDQAPEFIILAEFVTLDPDCPQGSTIARTWQAQDHCGNFSTCIQTITVQDTTRPVIVCPASVTIECDQPTTPANTGTATATDNCTPTANIVVTKTDLITAGTCPVIQTIRRTWLAGDGCDNGALCVQFITLIDSKGPLVECPKDTVVDCGTDTSPASLGMATATDNCNSATTPVFDDVITPGNCPQESIIERTWMSKDTCGNIGTCVQTITVQDTIAPEFQVPADITIYADANCQYDAAPTVTGTPADLTDNCATNLMATFTDDIADGTCAGNKVITRTWSLNDGCDNIFTQDQIITVQDTLKPLFPKPADMTLTTEDGATCPETADISLVADQLNPVATGADPFTFTVHGITIDGPANYSDNCSSGDDLKLFVWTINDDFGGTADSCQRQIRVVFRVYDDCGLFQQRQQTFTIVDNTAPKFTVPADLTLSCEQDVNDLMLAGDVTDESDNCQTGLEATYIDDNSGLTGCSNTGIILRTWTLEDGCGNSLVQTQTIAVVDNTPPVLTCPANLSIHCEVPAIPDNTGMAMATDNCGTPTVNFTDVSTQTMNSTCTDQTYTITRTWTAVDGCGNQATSCVQIINVRDIVPPVITCPAPVTISCTASTNPTVNTALGVATAVDNCDPQPGIDFTDLSLPGSCPQGRRIIRTWLTVDNCNNAAACSQEITVVDQTAPVPTCPKDTVINCDANYSIAALGMATAIDNCDPNPTVQQPPVETSTPGSCPQAQTITRTWTVIDACGNSATCKQTIIVQDTIRPVITCPPTVTLQCYESLDPMVNPNVGMATATDNCDTQLVIGKVDSDLGFNGCTQTILRNWIASDDCNTAAACSQLIYLTDSEGPRVTCPADTIVNCNADISPAALGMATAVDSCGAATTPTFEDVSTQTTDGSCTDFSYTITRTWTSLDDCGNEGICIQLIIVQDTTAPGISCPADLTINCGDALDPMLNTALGMATASDNCDSAPAISYADSTTTGACPTGVVIVRTWTAKDACGNTTTCVQHIGLNDNTPPTIICPAAVTAECTDELDPYLNTALGTATAQDDCGAQATIDYSDVADPGACPVVKVITRTWTVTDPCDNSTSCVQTITLEDLTGPAVSCPAADLTLECANPDNDSLIVVWLAEAIAVDACTTATVSNSYSPTAFSDGCGNTGVQIVSFSATDACGNSSTANCSATIIIIDTEAPVLTCPTADLTLECGNTQNDGLITAWLESATATDACGMTTISTNYSPTAFSDGCGNTGKQTVTFQAFDECQNSSTTCEMTISILDNTPPVVLCPQADLTLECGNPDNPGRIDVWLGLATATDNCGDATVSNNYAAGNFSDGCGATGAQTVTFSATDDCDNTSTANCTATITIVDTTPPTVNCPTAALILECADTANTNLITSWLATASATDACGAAAVSNSYSPTAFSDGCGQTGEQIVTFTATDECGNSSTANCTARISILDTTPPTLTCPAADLTLECADPANADLIATWLGTATGADACGTATVTTTYSPTAFSDGCGQTGVQTVSFQAFDECQNSSTTCAKTISILDNTPPVLTCPAPDLTLECGATQNQALITNWLASASATDACGMATVSNSYSPTAFSDSCGATGVQTVTFQAFDECQNSSTVCSAKIVIVDTTPPNFTVPKDTTLYVDALCQVNATNLGDVTDESDNCSTGLQATFVDVVVPGPGGTERTISRVWTLTDDCGNINVQTQTIAVRDTIAPMIVCPQNLVVGANTDSCTYAVPGTGLNPLLVLDNCGPDTLTYELSGATSAMGGVSLQGAVLEVGNTVVVWTATDINGNTASCSLVVRVQDCADITGKIIWEGNDLDTVGVAQVTVILTGDDSLAVGPTPASGVYSMLPTTGSNFMIKPSKPGPLTTIMVDPMNGVTADDALAILYHVYGFALITDPYKLIAADVNMDNAVTRDDEILIRRALLGSEPALDYFRNLPWRFVPDTTDTPWSLGYHPPANPFSALIPDKRILTGAGSGATNQNFYGIKKGDVNATANPLLHPVPVDPLILQVQDQYLSAGAEVRVLVKVQHFEDLAGYQFALEADPAQLRLESIETVWSPLQLTEADNFGLANADKGEIRSIWLDADGRTLADDAPVFALRFTALQSGSKLSAVLRLKPKSLEPWAYTATQARAALELRFTDVQTTALLDPLDAAKRVELLQNRPNPFQDRTIIGFVLPEACDAQLRIFDISGRELYRIDNNYPAGYNEETIELRDIRATGIMYYELTTPYGKVTRKMTAVAP